MSRRTKAPLDFLDPTVEEMKEAAAAVGLKGYSRDLVTDLARMAAGGQTVPLSAYRADLREEVEAKLDPAASRWEIPRSVAGAFPGGSGGVTSVYSTAIKAHLMAVENYNRRVTEFVDSLNYDSAPGSTPLQKAVAILAMLSKMKGGSGSGEGQPLPIFSSEAADPASDINEVMDIVESMTEEEREMLEKATGAANQNNPDLKEAQIAQEMADPEGARLILEVSRTLDRFTRLQVRRQRKVEADPEGSEVRQRPIKGLHELQKVPATAWAARQQNPGYFLYQAVSGQLPVRERVTRVERRQAIYIALDGSGSMFGSRHLLATGVVMNRLKAVLSGDAVVYLSVFDASSSRVRVASTPEEAHALIRDFTKGSFSGGGTDIAGAVKFAHKFIEEQVASGAMLYRPEVVVLTDDDNSAKGVKPSDIPGTRVHGFAMESKNPELAKLAAGTGGVMFEQFRGKART